MKENVIERCAHYSSAVYVNLCTASAETLWFKDTSENLADLSEKTSNQIIVYLIDLWIMYSLGDLKHSLYLSPPHGKIELFFFFLPPSVFSDTIRRMTHSPGRWAPFFNTAPLGALPTPTLWRTPALWVPPTPRDPNVGANNAASLWEAFVLLVFHCHSWLSPLIRTAGAVMVP